jgi:hypothetical protein
MPLPPDLSKPAFQIFPEAADLIMSGKCVTCGSGRLRNVDFRDELSKNEYGVSGMCQVCQDKVFGEQEPNWDDVEELYGEG